MKITLYCLAILLTGFAVSAIAATWGSVPLETIANVPEPTPVLVVGLVLIAIGLRLHAR